MKRHVIGILLLAAAAAGPARGESFLDRPYGTPVTGLSTRSRAMGGTGTAFDNGAYSLVDNPAVLSLGPGRRVQISGWVSRVSEDRLVPLYDTFGSFVNEAAVGVNDHGYASLDGGAVLDLRERAHLVVAAGIFQRYDPRYDYVDERRNTANTDDIVAQRFITTTGVLRAATLGAAYPLGSRWSLGAAFNWYFGRWSDRDALVPRATGETPAETTRVRDLSGPSATFGATFTANERWTLGLSYETSPQLHGEYSGSEDGVVVTAPGATEDLNLPWRLQGGAAYRPRNALLTTVTADVIYMPWSTLDDPLAPTVQLEDTWDFRFGLEHVYYNALPGRIGFHYERSYASREADRAAFTFGIGYRGSSYRFDLSGEIGKRTSLQSPLIPRAAQGPYYGAGQDRVEDTMVRLAFGVDVDF